MKDVSFVHMLCSYKGFTEVNQAKRLNEVSKTDRMYLHFERRYVNNMLFNASVTLKTVKAIYSTESTFQYFYVFFPFCSESRCVHSEKNPL